METGHSVRHRRWLANTAFQMLHLYNVFILVAFFSEPFTLLPRKVGQNFNT